MTSVAQIESSTESTTKTCKLLGAGWCGFTKKQQEVLDGGMQDELKAKGVHIEVTDCSDDKETCPVLRGYPTWQNSRGEMMPGYTSDVAKLSSFCSA
tara:strand:- start:13229 stop:13519 length:291 start_codon:yes stop_codon:yes gene_type:complete